jgi:hypothetical protein
MESIAENYERRLGIERRNFSYFYHIPERRSGKDRRSEFEPRSCKDIKNDNFSPPMLELTES